MDEDSYSVNLEYELSDGTWMRRRYTFALPAAMENERITDALSDVINAEEVRYKTTLNGKSGTEIMELRGGYITGKYISYSYQLSAEEAQRIYDAVLADLKSGAGGQEPFTRDELPDFSVYIELEAVDNNVWLERIRPDFKNLLAVLEEMDLDTPTLFQVDPELAEKYGW